MHLLAEWEELPRLLLWILGVEVSKQLSVSQVPQAGAVVSHDVGRSRDVVMLGQVAMMPLVEGCQAQEVGSRTSGGGGSFAVPVQSRCVVCEVVDGLLPDVSHLGKDIQLGNGACQLEVTVGDGARGIVKGDQGLDHWSREGCSPQDGR